MFTNTGSALSHLPFLLPPDLSTSTIVQYYCRILFLNFSFSFYSLPISFISSSSFFLCVLSLLLPFPSPFSLLNPSSCFLLPHSPFLLSLSSLSFLLSTSSILIPLFSFLLPPPFIPLFFFLPPSCFLFPSPPSFFLIFQSSRILDLEHVYLAELYPLSLTQRTSPTPGCRIMVYI